MGRRKEENGGIDAGIKKHNWWAQNRQGEIQNNIRNGEAKDLICTTHGHELSSGDCCREWGIPGRVGQKGKNWDNCSSIIN